MAKSITSANSVFKIRVPGLYDTPVELAAYATDRAWTTDSVELIQEAMSVDGEFTAGFTPNPIRQTITLQADSDSRDIFNAIYNAQKATRSVYYIYGTLVLPATGESITCDKGALKDYKPVPDGAKVLQAIDFSIVWKSMDPTFA